jgi:hypothetical protein
LAAAGEGVVMKSAQRLHRMRMYFERDEGGCTRSSADQYPSL